MRVERLVLLSACSSLAMRMIARSPAYVSSSVYLTPPPPLLPLLFMYYCCALRHGLVIRAAGLGQAGNGRICSVFIVILRRMRSQEVGIEDECIVNKMFNALKDGFILYILFCLTFGLILNKQLIIKNRCNEKSYQSIVNNLKFGE